MGRRLLAAVLVVALVQVAHATPSGAHLPGPYFHPTFVGNTSWPFGSMTVRFTNTFPNNQTWRDRVQEGHANWPQAATGRPPVYFMMAGAD